MNNISKILMVSGLIGVIILSSIMCNIYFNNKDKADVSEMDGGEWILLFILFYITGFILLNLLVLFFINWKIDKLEEILNKRFGVV